MPEEALPAKVWRLVSSHDPGAHQVQVELRPEKTVWVHVKGTLNHAGAGRLAEELSRALSKRQERLVLDFKHLVAIEEDAAGKIIQLLQQYRDRIRLAVPNAGTFAALTMNFEVY